jgi:PPP family 3-phenylpropionic acid transporter
MPHSHPLLRWRLPLFYMLSFSILGAVVPYLAAALIARGVTGWILAAAVGALPLGRLVAGPLWSVWTDRTQAPKQVLILGSLISIAGLVWLMVAESAWTVGAVFLLSVGRAPLGPVLDAITLDALGDQRRDYGRLRLWGSLGFIIGAMGSGLVWEHLGLSPLQLGIVLALPLLVLTIEMPLERGIRSSPMLPALKVLASDRALPWLLLAAALHFASHVGSTSFLAVHLSALGYSEDWTGLILATGVTVEIVLMSQARRLLSRFSARTIFLAAMLVATPRWLMTAAVDSAWLLLLLQSGHGFTFGAFWLAGVALISQRAPQGVETSAQALFSAAVGGVGAMLGMVGASVIVDHQPTHNLFLWGAAFSVLAIAAAWVGLRRMDGQASPDSHPDRRSDAEFP